MLREIGCILNCNVCQIVPRVCNISSHELAKNVIAGWLLGM